MKEFIWGLMIKFTVIALAIGAAGMAMLTLGLVAYALDIETIVLLVLIVAIALLWQIYEAVKSERERKRRDKELDELIERANRRKAAEGNE